jgi:choline dehydrogenase-like flavoprotein
VLERWRTEHGFDTPEATLELHVARVLQALRAVPIPEDRVNTANQLLRAGAVARGWRFQIPQHNRVECSGCGYCMIGCAYNRKVNAAGAFLQAAATQGATLLSDVQVQSFRRAGDSFVVQARGANGDDVRVRARRVVLAAGALETPLLLRRSDVQSSQAGRRLRLHPAPVVFARFEQRVEAWRGLPQAVIVNEFASFEQNGRGGFLFLPNAGTGPALGAAVAPAYGEHHALLMRQYPHLASAAVLLHDESTGLVRGGPGRPTVHYWPDLGDRQELLRGVRALAELYFAAGAQEVYLPFEAGRARRAHELEKAMSTAQIRRHELPLTSVHPQGTCAMGKDPYRSVVRPTGAVWQAPGVYVADASLFPTSIGVPPQVTIMALAGVVADNVAAELQA